MEKEKELYKKRYDFEKIKKNVFELVEANGYLIALHDSGCNDAWIGEELTKNTLSIVPYAM